MAKFTKAKSEQAFLKLALYGKTGSGKTLTSLLFAEGMAQRDKKRIAYIDTERGTEFYAMEIPERKIHPAAFDFDRIITRSLMETIEAVEGIDPAEYGILVIDSVTHLWEAARAAYQGKLMSNGGIPVQAWNEIKKPYKKLMSLFLDGNFHAIVCGREGVVMEDDIETGETKVTGSKMKAEGETPYEPHLLGRMVPERGKDGSYLIRIFFEKDRSGILTGKTFEWPNYATIEPVVSYLLGGVQGKLGTAEENAEVDAEKQAQQEERTERERTELFTAIRDSINSAHTVEALKAAWLLTSGKKTKLGPDNFGKLETLKEARKAELLREVA